MQPTRPALGPAPAETPGPFAELEIQVGPAQPWGTAKGRVPPDQANHLISAFGALGSATAGITGAVLTLRISPHLTGPAYAELALALIAAVLIAFRRRADHQAGGHPDTAGRSRGLARSGPSSAP